MSLNEWNWFEERIATLVLMARLPIAIARAFRERPTRPADALMLGAISFVTHFDNENGLVPDTPAPELRHRYRVIAILAADLPCSLARAAVRILRKSGKTRKVKFSGMISPRL